MSGGKCGVPVGSARVSGGARDMTLARPRLLNHLPDDRRRGGERESSPAPKRQKFSCSNVCVLAALSPLRASGIRILNYLDDWLILAQSRDTLLSHIDSLLIHLESLGQCVHRRKSILAPSQSITYLGVCTDSLEMRARLSRERAAAILSYLRHFREGSSVHLKKFSEAVGPHGVSSAGMSSGLITHVTTAAMAEILSPLDSVDFGTFEYRGHLRLASKLWRRGATRISSDGESPRAWWLHAWWSQQMHRCSAGEAVCEECQLRDCGRNLRPDGT